LQAAEEVPSDEGGKKFTSMALLLAQMQNQGKRIIQNLPTLPRLPITMHNLLLLPQPDHQSFIKHAERGPMANTFAPTEMVNDSVCQHRGLNLPRKITSLISKGWR
jgi:hypothetical protein